MGDGMFEIVSLPDRGFALQISDDAAAGEFEEYLKEERYVLFERRPEAKCIRFLFGEAGSEKAVDALVQGFLEFQKAEDAKDQQRGFRE